MLWQKLHELLFQQQDIATGLGPGRPNSCVMQQVVAAQGHHAGGIHFLGVPAGCRTAPHGLVCTEICAAVLVYLLLAAGICGPGHNLVSCIIGSPIPMICRARVESEVESAFRESLEQNCYHERARRDNLLRWGRKEQAKNLPTPRQVLAQDLNFQLCGLPVKSSVCLFACAGD